MREAHVKFLEIKHWLTSTKQMIKAFSFISFNHIYPEINVQDDTLSKHPLGMMDDKLSFSHFDAKRLVLKVLSADSLLISVCVSFWHRNYIWTDALN